MTSKIETLKEENGVFEVEQNQLTHQEMNMILDARGLNWVKLKVVEELNELATAIVQTMTKPDRVKPEEVTDELGDVILHLPFVLGLYDPKIINDRMVDKRKKILKQYENKKTIVEDASPEIQSEQAEVQPS